MRHRTWGSTRHRGVCGVFAVVVLVCVSISAGMGTFPAPISAAGTENAAEFSVPAPRTAAVYTVNALGEPANGADATCTTPCTLRQAINASNANDPGSGNHNTIIFAPATFGTAHTITLIDATGFRTLKLTKSVTITGPGANVLTIDGGCTNCGAGMTNDGPGVGVFNASGTITVAIAGITIANGFAFNAGAIYTASPLTITNCVFTNNYGYTNLANSGGGAIFVSNTSLTVTGSTFTGNFSRLDGGAINASFGSTLTVTGSTFIGNAAVRDGGAIGNRQNGALTITGNTFTGNTVQGDGGAVRNDGGTVTVAASTFTGNSAYAGGAIMNIVSNATYPARLTLINSTVSGNTTTGGTSGTVETDNVGATTAIAGSTISGNNATGYSSTGGVYTYGGGVVVLTDTISAGNTVEDTTSTPTSSAIPQARHSPAGTISSAWETARTSRG